MKKSSQITFVILGILVIAHSLYALVNYDSGEISFDGIIQVVSGIAIIVMAYADKKKNEKHFN